MAGPPSVSSSASPRVPVALQQIFIQSQRGDEVSNIDAPKNGMGFRIFKRSWGKKVKKTKQIKVPSITTIDSDRTPSTTFSAADASRKAMKEKPVKTIKDEQSPQAYLDKAIAARGYSVRKFCSLEGGYYCRPTPMQQASYGTRISQAIRGSDGTLLRRLLDAGLSPNPCNNFGESLVHMVCRRGDHKLLRILLEAGCSLQVTDDYGRTPLHDACWRAEPAFETVQLILDSDKRLLHLVDCRGAAPLSYVKKENYAKWIKFLESKMERFWPIRDVATEGDERPPPLTLRPPHSLPVPDPAHALPLDVAAMVANGRMEPEEALYLDDSEEDDSESYDSDDDSDITYSDEDGDDSSCSSDDSDVSDYERQIAEFCLRGGGPVKMAQNCLLSKDAKNLMSGGRKAA